MTFFTASAAFSHWYKVISEQGTPCRDTKAMYNASFEILSPEQNLIIDSLIERKWSKQYADREWFWYLTGNRSVKEMKKYAKIWDTMHNGDDMVWSNYGYWWLRNGQLAKMIHIMKKDPTTRRAVVVHYSPDEVDNFEKDTPCNIALNFYIVDDQLYLTIFARSIDLWYGFCNDQYIFSKLMRIVLDELNHELKLTMGSMNWFVTNLHLYNKHL